MGKPLGKHLDLSKRQVIFNCLENCATAIEIAALVNLHPTSISREIKKRRTYKPGNVGDTSICVDCANKKLVILGITVKISVLKYAYDAEQ